jgi:hypothetical protein
MSTLREALPDEGDEEEARTLVSRHPVRIGGKGNFAPQHLGTA